VPTVGLALVPPSADRLRWAVQKLTELGVDRIVPVLAERSVSRPDPDRAAGAAERWRRISREAARQCRRATLPAIEEVRPLASLAGHPGVVVAERGGAPAEALPPPPDGETLVVIGPEGGLAPEEVEALKPWGRLGLGPHVLRAETAALAAAMVLTSLRRPVS
jgi:16S rRNA (uracil1498-N3)-methyltransferase